MEGLWNAPGVPHKGWYCAEVIDLEEAVHTCQMCGKEEIRYVHVMAHKSHSELQVGCICAEKMSEDSVGPKEREKNLRNRAKRRTNWLVHRGWRTNVKGSYTIRANGWTITAYPKEIQGRAMWGYIASQGNNKIWSRKLYDNDADARLGEFDAAWPRKQSILNS
jgi:hypothetical protein